MTGVTRPRWEERDLAHWRRGLGDDFETTGGGDGCWTYIVMEFSSMKHQREHRMGNYMSFDPLIWRGEQVGANRRDLEQGVQRATELGFLVRHRRKVAASPLLQVLLAVEYITRVLRPTGPRTLGPAPIVTVHKLLHLLKVGGDGARPHPGLLEGIERGLLHVSQSNHATWVEVRWGADSGPAPGQAPPHLSGEGSMQNLPARPGGPPQRPRTRRSKNGTGCDIPPSPSWSGSVDLPPSGQDFDLPPTDESKSPTFTSGSRNSSPRPTEHVVSASTT